MVTSGGGGTFTSGQFEESIQKGRGVNVTVPAVLQRKIASKTNNKILKIITHFNVSVRTVRGAMLLDSMQPMRTQYCQETI